MRTPGVFISEWMLPVVAIDVEFLAVLRIGQAGHEADAGDRAVRPDVAIDAGRRAQRRIGGLAQHHDFLAVVVDHARRPRWTT